MPQFVAFTFLERHKQTSIHLHRKSVAVPSKPNWVSQWLSYRGLVWSYLEERDGSPISNSYITSKSHPIMNDGDLMEATWQSLSVSLTFPMHSSISQDHLLLGWAGGSHSWNLRGGYHNTSLGCHRIALFLELILSYGWCPDSSQTCCLFILLELHFCRKSRDNSHKVSQ